jgi:AraC-like DNA-binding protein
VITFPLVWIVSILTIIAAFALSQNDRVIFQARFYLTAFFLLLAVIGLLLGMRLSFQSQLAADLQPLIAVMIAPSAYLGFRALTQETPSPFKQLFYWNWLPVLVSQAVMIAKILVSADFFILGITGIYLIKTAGLLRYESDAFKQVPPNGLNIVRAAISATVFLFAMMVTLDGLIIVAAIFADNVSVVKYVTGVSGLFTAFIFIVALLGLPLILRTSISDTTACKEPTDQDVEMIARLEKMMVEKRLYTDSNLTLARVAKRLSVPVRNVSEAINRSTGENFSRYINNYRISLAKKILSETDLPITEVMFEAGFVSKSSFNTEFRRLTGLTPSLYRENLSNSN